MQKGRSVLLGAASVAVVLGAWEIVGRSGWVHASLFPPASQVARALRAYAASGDLFADLRASVWRAFVGLAAGSCLGVVLGLLTGGFAAMRSILSPVLNSLRALPPVALIPFMIIWFGIDDASKVLSISCAVVFPVWISTDAGVRNVPRAYLWAASTLGAPGWETLLRVILPSALPFIIAGLRNATALAFVMVFVSELAGASDGLGYRIAVSHLAYRVDSMIAALLVLAACASLADFILMTALRRSFPWLSLAQQR